MTCEESQLSTNLGKKENNSSKYKPRSDRAKYKYS